MTERTKHAAKTLRHAAELAARIEDADLEELRVVARGLALSCESLALAFLGIPEGLGDQPRH